MQKRHFLAAIVSASLLCTALSLQAQTPNHRGPMPAPKNLQVLPKNISHDDLMKVMHGFAGSLGVKCSFCHVVGPEEDQMDFASDAKLEKQTARTMMRMTHAINANDLAKIDVPDAKPDQKNVNCGTCHRGQAIPASFVLPRRHEHHG